MRQDFIYWDPTNGDPYRFLVKKFPKVCCFSVTDENILMWSHYGDYLRGICLRFRSIQVADGYFLFFKLKTNSIFKIDYKGEVPEPVNTFDTESKDITFTFFNLKLKFPSHFFEKHRSALAKQ